MESNEIQIQLSEKVSSTFQSTNQSKGWLLSTLAIIGAFLWLASWAVSSPVGSSPDEDFHLASIWCGEGTNNQTCLATSDHGTRKVPVDLLNANCFANKKQQSANCQVFSSSTEWIETDRGSFIGNYPPVYYWVAHHLVSSDIPLSVGLIRIMNILIFLAMTSSLILLAKNKLKWSVYWMWLSTMVPLGAFIVASVNPSSWAITGVGSSCIALYIVFRASRWRIWFAAAIYLASTLLAAGSRADAGIYVVISSLAVIVLSLKEIKKRPALLGIAAISAVFSVWMYFQTTQTVVASTGLATSVDIAGRVPSEVFISNLWHVPALWLGSFGLWPLGWFDTPLPAIVWLLSGGAFLVLLFVAMRKLDKSRALSAIFILVVLYLLPLYVLQKGMNLVGEEVQPRYLLPLIVVFAGICFIDGTWMAEDRWTKVAVLFAITALFSANCVALYINLKRYASGLSTGSWIPLIPEEKWWWLSGIVPTWAVLLVGSLSFLTFSIIGYKALQQSKN